MKNAYSPTYQDIKDWAYNSKLYYPEQDWDIVVFDDVADDILTSIVLEIASDATCFKQKAFIHFLNIMTGSVVRFAAKNGFKEEKLKKLEELITKAETSNCQLVSDWAVRSKVIIQSPETFRYDDWYD
jgi:hypothetical protein